MNKRTDCREQSVEAELKEAVCESLLRGLNNSVSGGGESGKELVDCSPSFKFVSGFLQPVQIPRRYASGGDETTNPIHIISIGTDIQVKKSKSAIIEVKPRFSLYVRLLPKASHLEKYRVKLSLNDASRKKLNESVRSVISVFDKDFAQLKEENKSEFYEKRQELRQKTATKYLSKELGLVLSDKEESGTHKPDEEDILPGLSTPEGENVDFKSLSEDEEKSSLFHIDYYVFPNMESVIPSNVVKPARPTQRWYRIDLNDLEGFSFSADSSPADIESLVKEQNVALREVIRKKLSDWFNHTDEDVCGKLWAYPTGLTLTPEDIQNWDDTLVRLRKEFHSKNDLSLFSFPQINLEWNIDITPGKDDPNMVAIKILLENMTDNDRQRLIETEFEESVFLAGLAVSVEKGSHIPIRLDRIKPSYRYNSYLSYDALGINCGVNSRETDESIAINTTTMPVYRQPRIVPVTRGKVDLSFKGLASDDGLRSLDDLPVEFEKWIEDTGISIDYSAGVESEQKKLREKEKFEEDIKKWRCESDKIRHGIALLHDSNQAYIKDEKDIRAIPFKAWLYMNEAMGLAAGNKYTGWRLFQLCFILSQLPGVVSRIECFHDYYDKSWDESVVLLYFATGGGKTESFFGLLVFNLFFDRLRGKHHGVTAMIRYPLRLLTIQQAQRLAKTLAKAETVRWKYGIEGDSFTIGFWVGGTNTPNRRADISNSQIPDYESACGKSEEDLCKSSEYRLASEDWNKLPKCPFCGEKTVLRKFPSLGGVIGHVCVSQDSDCSWNQHYAGKYKQPLPFLIIDEDIYEKAPSVVLGTIDKLALIGQRASTIRKFIGMLGFAPHYDRSIDTLKPLSSPDNLSAINHQKINPFYNGGSRHFLDPFPSLIIQDEAHLLEESLGTFSGIFETAFEEFLKQIGKHKRVNSILSKVPNSQVPRLPKIVAASATVSNPERQMEDLYQREVTQFPVPGPTLYTSFYAEPQSSNYAERQQAAKSNIEFGARTARFYVTFLTNGRPHTSTTVEVLGYFHLIISRYLSSLASGEKEQTSKVRQELGSNLEDSFWKQHYQSLIAQASDDQLATLIDLHRIALTYVTNKKGGDQIMAAELDTAGRIHEDAEMDWFEGFNAKLISGALSASEIEKVIEEAEDRPKVGDDLQDIKDEGLLRSVVATSAISHGVDVDEFNTMFFAGMPSDTAEYIQSSSRVGRTHVGCSILLPTPQRRRDRYILEIHDQYHRFLERMIRPPAVNRWAENAILRTLPSLIQLYLIGVLELQELLDADNDRKHMVKNYERLDSISRQINAIEEIAFKNQLCDFIFSAIGLNHTKFAPSAAREFKEIIRDDIYESYLGNIEPMKAEGIVGLKEFFDEINTKIKDFKRTAMTSLRDVDPAGRLSYEKKANVTDPSSAQVHELIKLIRSGSGGQ